MTTWTCVILGAGFQAALVLDMEPLVLRTTPVHED
jgi:hypothetical protein